MNTTPKDSPKTALEHNYKRAKRLAINRATGIRYAGETINFRNSVEIESDEINDFLDRFQKSVGYCGSQSLCAVELDTHKHYASMKTANYCNHRFCPQCNYMRSRLLRRKYFAFLTNTEPAIQLKPMHLSFFENPQKPGFIAGSELLTNLDFMHLTLTVPHNQGIWNGKGYYAAELIQLFNLMRKKEWWLKQVFGGEYCVETTNTANGMHVHLHVLAMVKKVQQSRNKLYAEILKAWNKCTIDFSLPPLAISPERVESLAKGLGKGTHPATKQKIISCLDGRGSTMVGLKELYYQISETEYNRRTNRKFIQDGKFYAYCSGANVRSLVMGVMECLKYHFEPCVMENEDGGLNIPLIMEMLPNVYRKRLYGKFGGLYKVKTLNIMEVNEDATSEDLEGFDATARDAIPHPYTGEPTDPGELVFVSVDASRFLFKDNGRHYRINNPDKDINFVDRDIGPGGLKQAVKNFMHTVRHKRELNNEEGFYEYNK